MNLLYVFCSLLISQSSSPRGHPSSAHFACWSQPMLHSKTLSTESRKSLSRGRTINGRVVIKKSCYGKDESTRPTNEMRMRTSSYVAREIQRERRSSVFRARDHVPCIVRNMPSVRRQLPYRACGVYAVRLECKSPVVAAERDRNSLLLSHFRLAVIKVYP
jgi:hypothetical protein